MNISFNINAATVAGGFKGAQKTAGKPVDEVGSAPQSSGSSSSSELFEVSGQQPQQPSVAASPIPDVATADSHAHFLKSVIIALPALVLAGQGNVNQQSAEKLLQ